MVTGSISQPGGIEKLTWVIRLPQTTLGSRKEFWDSEDGPCNINHITREVLIDLLKKIGASITYQLHIKASITHKSIYYT